MFKTKKGSSAGGEESKNIKHLIFSPLGFTVKLHCLMNTLSIRISQTFISKGQEGGGGTHAHTPCAPL